MPDAAPDPAAVDARGAELFRPTDPDFLHDPYPAYARLRAEAPIFSYLPWGKRVVTRYRDIDRLLRDKRLGRVIHHRLESAELPPRDPAKAPFDAIQAGSILELEPPDHSRVRAVVHEVFTPKHVRALEREIAALVERLIDRLEARPDRQADLIGDFAEALPVTVIADLLGVPEADRRRLLPWSKGIIGMFEPERTPAMEADAVRSAAEFSSYLRELIEVKRAHPADDLISRMTAAHDDDPERFSEGEIVANGILFLNAGHEAVVNVLGNGMKALLQRPEERARVAADPARAATAVEEMMRFDTPLQFFERFVLEDLEFEADDGRVHALRRGDKLCLYYASANRDAAVFDDPDRFDGGRDPNPHMAFGRGIHYCIGAPLARLELSQAVTRLLARLPQLQLAQDTFHYQPRNVFRYMTELRVRY